MAKKKKRKPYYDFNRKRAMFKAPATLQQRRFIEENINLVIHLSYRYSKAFNVPMEDLKQEGVFGLISATQKFNPARAKFSTYAYRWIKQVMLNYCHKHQAAGLTPGFKSKAQGLERPQVHRFNVITSEDSGAETSEEAMSLDCREDEVGNQVANKELIRKVMAYVARLPAKRQRVVRLMLKGIKPKDVEEQTGVSRQLAQQYFARFSVELGESLNIDGLNRRYAKCIQCGQIKRFDSQIDERCPKCVAEKR